MSQKNNITSSKRSPEIFCVIFKLPQVKINKDGGEKKISVTNADNKEPRPHG